MTITTAKWTLEDYHRMIDAGILEDRHVELLHGEIVEMSPEGPNHADLNSEAADYLRSLLGDRVKIREGKPITLPNRSEPEPDIAVVEKRSYREHHPYPQHIFWLIEFSDSSLAKDLDVKRKIYAEAGISEYWVVNLRASHLIVLRSPLDGDYQSEEAYMDETVQPIAFPNTSISVQHILQ